MNQNGKNPVEQEYHTSQVYKTLAGSGIPAADMLARGLGKAAAGVDAAIQSVGPAVQSAAQSFQEAQRQNRQAAPQNQQTWQTRPPQPGGNSSTYRYPGKTVRPPPQQVYHPGGQSGNPGRPGGNAYQQPQPRRPQGVTPVPPPQMPPMKVVHMGSPAKYYITGVLALVYAMNFQMMELQEWVAFGIVVLLTFLLSGAIFRGKKQLVPVEEPKPEPKPQPEAKKEPEPEKKSATGNPEVDKIIDEGHEYLKKLRAANDAIPDEALSADIDRMERASADIFNYISAHPEKASQIRKFMNYYLPTTLKLLNSYERLSKQSVKGENITSTMFNIAGMMHTVADAFEKQLDSLFTDEAMDISADITVFESMLKQEGFVEEKRPK